LNLLFQCFLTAQHVSGDTPPIIRSSKTVTAVSGFTYVFGRQLLWWPSQQSATKNVCKTRNCNYSFWAPDDGRCVARNMLSN